MPKIFYRKKLPHYQPPEALFFITYRLAGSIPVEVIRKLQDDYQRLELELFASSAEGDKLQTAIADIREGYFIETDNFLDRNLNEPYWLKEEPVAKIVADSLHFLERNKIKLYCYCIMPNHVHVLFSLKNADDDLFRIMQRHKSYTAGVSNRILKHSGQFWERESYDHVVRDGEFERIVNYILNNPVKAGFVNNWLKWKWSYLNPELL
ncbi:MAG: transposase [Sphingobacteriales bacterium]|nr:transposase [Sphingobacteriales bacterium]MBI3718850.1 transposase [Sphingobacteriales bacterium]